MKKILSIFCLILIFSCNNDDDIIPTTPTPPSPTSGFNELNDEYWEDCPITFENTSQDATSFLWEFGDGNTSTEENPTHAYEEAGVYEVILTASNSVEQSTNTMSIEVMAATKFELINDLEYSPSKRINDFIITPDGGYITTGLAGSPFNPGYPYSGYILVSRTEVVKVDASGMIEWAIEHEPIDYTPYYIPNTESSSSIIPSNEGDGYIAAITQNISPIGRVVLIKIDNTGNVLMEKTLDFPSTENYYISKIINAIDGGYVAIVNNYLVKLDNDMDIVWMQPINNQPAVKSLIRNSSNDGYVITGWTSSANGSLNFMMNFSLVGALIWENSFLGARILDTEMLEDGSYISVGTNTSGSYIVKVSQNGNTINDANFPNVKFHTVTSTDNGKFAVAGNTDQMGGYRDIYLAEFSDDLTLEWEIAYDKSTTHDVNVIRRTDDCGFIIGGTLGGEYISSGFLIKTDGRGNFD